MVAAVWPWCLGHSVHPHVLRLVSLVIWEQRSVVMNCQGLVTASKSTRCTEMIFQYHVQVLTLPDPLTFPDP